VTRLREEGGGERGEEETPGWPRGIGRRGRKEKYRL